MHIHIFSVPFNKKHIKFLFNEMCFNKVALPMSTENIKVKQPNLHLAKAVHICIFQTHDPTKEHLPREEFTFSDKVRWETLKPVKCWKHSAAAYLVLMRSFTGVCLPLMVYLHHVKELGALPASQWVCCRGVPLVMSSTGRRERRRCTRVRDFHFCWVVPK